MAILTPTSEETRIYELCALLPSSLEKDEEKKIQEELEGFLKEVDATIHKKDVWDTRGLAYSIKGYTEGKMNIYYLEMKPENIKTLDENLRISSGVLRHLLIKPPKNYEVISYANRFEEWKQEQSSLEEQAKETVEEQLRKKVVANTRRKTERAEKKAREEQKEKAAPLKKEELEERIGKIISDQDLDL